MDGMREIHDDDLMVRLAVDDARTAQDAGAKFARTLAGAAPADFMLALGEQGDLVRRWITEAGCTDAQAQLAAGRFEAAARAEWRRLVDAGVDGAVGRA